MSSSTVINTNTRALNSNRNLRAVGNKQDKASKRLSSGKKINSAADDAAGMAISTKMKAQIRGLDMASKNAQDGLSLLQTAEGYVDEVTNMVQRIRELAVQAATDTNQTADREKLQSEVSELLGEIDAMAGRAQFNKIQIGDGTGGDSGNFVFHVGANAGQTISVKLEDLTVASGKCNTLQGKDVSAARGSGGADDVIGDADTVLDAINTYRATLGAAMNRIEYTNNALEVASENLSAANSRIEDADMAKEMTNLTSANVINQAAVSMLAQANQAPQSVLQLLS